MTRRSKGPGGARPGAGRPPSPDPKRHKVTIKLTDSQLVAVQTAAAREGRSVSEWGGAAFELAIARGSTR